MERENPKFGEKILTQCHFVYHKCDVDCPVSIPASPNGNFWWTKWH